MTRPPYRVLFSNDTTNIETCVSPYHRKGEDFRPEMLEATVDETAGAGVEVHMLQPGLGQVPWWRSAVCPDAYQWWQARYGAEPDGYAKYMLGGGDMVAVFISRCRQRGLVPFLSLRLNDGHGLEFVDAKLGEAPSWTGHALSRFHVEHPEYRIGPDPHDWDQHVLNWAIPEVRAHKFAFIRELCEQYDLDGFELDFMRHTSYFRLGETSTEERAAIMTGFVRDVRELLDRTAAPGQHRWLCVRVPCHQAAHDRLGICLPEMVEAGAEMVNLSAFYFTEQQTDAPAIRRLIPEAAAYLEMTHTTYLGPITSTQSGYDNFSFRRTTPEQFFTAAHLAYARGLDGVSAFNFVYYREHGTPGRGPFDEPPFHVFRHLGNPDWLARQPQHYILAEVWDEPRAPNRQMPRRLEAGQTARFALDMAPPRGGWTREGKLRIQSRAPLGAAVFTASMNGIALAPIADVDEPYPNPYSPLLGTPETLRAWRAPAGIPWDGVNTVEIGLREGDLADLVVLDLAIA